MLHSQNFHVNQETHKSNGEAKRTAIILAAGMGVRLGDQGKLTPKGCLCLGEKSIVEESVLRLMGVGIERIVIVTGHLAKQFEPLRDRYRQTVQLVHNPYFADSGSMYSLYCARHCIKDDFLLLESDLVYERRALTVCLEDPSDNVVLLADFSGSNDECFVEMRNGRLVDISKNRESLGSEVSGELVGISKISSSLFSVMLETAEQRFSTTRHVDYEIDCLAAAAQVVPISCPLVEDLIWCEIDDETHLARARNEVHPVVKELDAKRELYARQRLQSNLSQFKTVGFFDERDLIIHHIHDFFETVNAHQIRACIMFGTLLGKVRHNDFIPWDDDVDIVVFDFDAFLEQCAPELERQGYTVEPDVYRDGKRMGCRIFREDSAKIPGNPHLRFPWIGIWEHKVGEDGLIVLPPEDVRYRPEDFLPLKQTDFLGALVGVPYNSTAILNTYFGSDDWMEVCQLPYRDHRNGGERTGFPNDTFKLQTVLDYLAAEHSRATSQAVTHHAK
jgi:2-aminoethylphosphonate-pyruvate transaminase